MKNYRKSRLSFLLIMILAAASIIGCTPPVGGTDDTNIAADAIAPKVISTIPVDLATGVATNSSFSATFDETMLSSTITDVTFTSSNTAAISGTVSYAGSSATFTPSAYLEANTVYTATISTGVTDLAGNAMAAATVWSFTTAATASAIGPMPVILGTAGNFAILAKTAISTVPLSTITGDIGLSPAAESFMTGFSQTGNIGYSTSTQVVGFMYAADMTSPTPTTMTTAISDMETAYTGAAGRVTPDFIDLYTGAVGGKVLLPGLYTWNTSVSILSDVTISGGANDTWIFQISGDLNESAAKQVILEGGAQAKNIVWQVSGTVTVGTGAHFEGIILGKTSVTLMTGATMNGRVLAQTNVSLDQATVTQPAL